MRLFSPSSFLVLRDTEFVNLGAILMYRIVLWKKQSLYIYIGTAYVLFVHKEPGSTSLEKEGTRVQM